MFWPHPTRPRREGGHFVNVVGGRYFEDISPLSNQTKTSRPFEIPWEQNKINKQFISPPSCFVWTRNSLSLEETHTQAVAPHETNWFFLLVLTSCEHSLWDLIADYARGCCYSFLVIVELRSVAIVYGVTRTALGVELIQGYERAFSKFVCQLSRMRQ